jgi:hypothetical protein
VSIESIIVVLLVFQTVLSVVSFFISFFDRRRIEGRIHVVHLATDGMKDALVAATDAAAFLRGEASQRTKDAPQPMQRLQQIEKQIEKTGQPDAQK